MTRDKGGECVCYALRVNKSLQVIWLNDNDIGNEGARSLALSFSLNKSLIEVSLSCSRLAMSELNYWQLSVATIASSGVFTWKGIPPVVII